MPRHRALWAAFLAFPLAAAHGGEKFEPERGKTLLIVGQERGEIARYWNEVGLAGGYMLYTSLPALDGLREPARGSGCSDSGWMDFGDWARGYPDTVAQVGLYLVGVTEKVGAGELDPQIAELARILRESGKPVFLRIGYECDGPWNRYPPDSYRRAWRRIADTLRGHGVGRGTPAAPVTNVALVWHSGAYATHAGHPFQAWYPGDDVVDWVAVSWFPWARAEDEAIASAARDHVAAFARQHRKPLMIAEAAPKAYFEADAPGAWTGWHARVFAWIAKNDVKAYCYVNQDWNKMPQWRAECGQGGDRGDTRVQKPGSVILEAWRKEVEGPRWLRQGPGLFRAIGFVPASR
jgi:endo-1,3-beta-xylanase